jgi:CubicO group peptidase (beta-lactamase class C family)
MRLTILALALLASMLLTPAALASSVKMRPIPTENTCKQRGEADAYTVDEGARDSLALIERSIVPIEQKAESRPQSVGARMARYAAPALSVAVMRDGRLYWAKAWGFADLSTCRSATIDTSFQAASITKAVTAFAALGSVQSGRVTLDENITNRLQNWRLRTQKGAEVETSLRALLSHTAGVTTHGFAGYPKGSIVPSLMAVLDGRKPANSAPIRIELARRGKLVYSGGGYVVIQKLLTDIEGRSFETIVDERVLSTFGMRRSFFVPSDSESNIAKGYVAGRNVEGGYHVYPESAPAGLWSTPIDLLRFANGVVEATAFGTDTAYVDMLREQPGGWGLGFWLEDQGAGRRIAHGGVNEGYESFLVAYPESANAIAVMTNGQKALPLIDEIIRTIGKAYGWKELAVCASAKLESCKQ